MGDLISCIEDDPTKCDLATGLLPDLPCKKMLKSCDELEVRALRNIFDQFDVDNDGSITRVELRDSLIRFGKKPTDKSVDKMVRQLDLTVDTGRAKSSSIFNFSSGRDSASRKKSADDGAIDFADFSRGMLARNSLLYKFLYAGFDNTEEEHEAERLAKAPKKRTSVFSGMFGGGAAAGAPASPLPALLRTSTDSWKKKSSSSAPKQWPFFHTVSEQTSNLSSFKWGSWRSEKEVRIAFPLVLMVLLSQLVIFGCSVVSNTPALFKTCTPFISDEDRPQTRVFAAYIADSFDPLSLNCFL
ncbi:hypothetical protein TeGR_g3467 [Tetraparma gracilis]|uniref:EF-hand domain-containing protein n=1 Tax=Tetraparma gracilis TaxID=2962635 RepID=A0ABQ6MLH2_9STRA|nr:hypothetical protein TeGR_g3467 [Tetraparma gracilis]